MPDLLLLPQLLRESRCPSHLLRFWPFWWPTCTRKWSRKIWLASKSTCKYPSVSRSLQRHLLAWQDPLCWQQWWTDRILLRRSLPAFWIPGLHSQGERKWSWPHTKSHPGYAREAPSRCFRLLLATQWFWIYLLGREASGNSARC